VQQQPKFLLKDDLPSGQRNMNIVKDDLIAMYPNSPATNNEDFPEDARFKISTTIHYSVEVQVKMSPRNIRDPPAPLTE
jgi:hypothetical protein